MKFRLIVCALLFAGTVAAQDRDPVNSDRFKSVKWTLVKMDSTFDGKPEGKTKKIIAKYKPTIDDLLNPIGTSAKELSKARPESGLSNWAVDVMKSYADGYIKENHLKKKCDFSLTNFGGLRTVLPKGDVTSYDILSIFPFENNLILVDLEGKYVRELMDSFAQRNTVEAMSGVEIVIRDRKVEKCLINGKPIKDNKVYRIATIDFLLQGGDGVYSLKKASNVISSGKVLRDLFIEHIKGLTAKGEVIDAHKDGRAKIINSAN